MTVAEVSALLYLPGHPPPAADPRIANPALSPGWKTSLWALLDQAEGDQGRATGNTGLTTAAGGPAARTTGSA
jgi:hypothetical protein